MTKVIKTKLGSLTLSANDDGIESIEFGARKTKSTVAPTPKAASHLEKATRQIEKYLDGKSVRFDMKLAPKRGTEFQKKVWAALAQIPYGETRSYGDIAKAIGKPKAARAVGMANNRNPLPLVVPCHRVIGHNGALVGFGGGLPLKTKLLRLEGAL